MRFSTVLNLGLVAAGAAASVRTLRRRHAWERSNQRAYIVLDYDDALAIANNTEYGLTGAVYTTSQEKIDRAMREFHVGNLYINRKCTGAVVGANPFGGFNMSGTDSKAGGRDYLGLFLQAKAISRKVRGESQREGVGE